jgi:hypothetical protein
MITDVVPFDRGVEFLEDIAAFYRFKTLQAVLAAPEAVGTRPTLAEQTRADYQPAN